MSRQKRGYRTTGNSARSDYDRVGNDTRADHRGMYCSYSECR